MKRLNESFPALKDSLGPVIVKKFRVNAEDLPSLDAGTFEHYRAKLCLDFLHYDIADVHTPASLMPESPKKMAGEDSVMESEEPGSDVKPSAEDLQQSETQKALELVRQPYPTFVVDV